MFKNTPRPAPFEIDLPNGETVLVDFREKNLMGEPMTVIKRGWGAEMVVSYCTDPSTGKRCYSATESDPFREKFRVRAEESRRDEFIRVLRSYMWGK